MDFQRIANPGVLRLNPYVPGKSVESLQREYQLTDIIKLASNENPLGPSPQALDALAASQRSLACYPEADCFQLRAQLAAKLGCEPQQIIIGNGSDNILDLLGLTFAGPNTEVIYGEYAFANFAITANAHHATAVVTPSIDWGNDLSAMLAAITERTRLIFIANPNNPTGTLLEQDALRAFLQKVPERVIVVIDEAYYEFISNRRPEVNALKLLSEFNNVVVTRTFSKIYGLAGLRIGYGLAHPELIDLLNRVRLPFNVNSMGQAAALASLADDEHVAATLKLTQAAIELFEHAWQQRGLNYIPSAANFTTVEFGAKASNVYQALLQQGIITRPLLAYNMPNHLRISVGLPEQNQRLLNAIDAII